MLAAGTQAQSGDPALHTRTASRPDAVPQTTEAAGHTDLPPEAEGRYRWGRSGSHALDTIELYFEQGLVHGYMTEQMDPSPHAAPVTFLFATTHADGAAIDWTTREVHGTRYSFHGHLQRGPDSNPRQPGYYLLIGTITEHGGDADGLVSNVSLKREPGTL